MDSLLILSGFFWAAANDTCPFHILALLKTISKLELIIMRHKNKTISGVDFHPSSSLKFMMHISFRYKFGLTIYAGNIRIYDHMCVFNYYSFDDIYSH